MSLKYKRNNYLISKRKRINSMVHKFYKFQEFTIKRSTNSVDFDSHIYSTGSRKFFISKIRRRHLYNEQKSALRSDRSEQGSSTNTKKREKSKWNLGILFKTILKVMNNLCLESTKETFLLYFHLLPLYLSFNLTICLLCTCLSTVSRHYLSLSIFVLIFPSIYRHISIIYGHFSLYQTIV